MAKKKSPFKNIGKPVIKREAGSTTIRAYWKACSPNTATGSYKDGKKTKKGTCYKFKEYSIQWYYKTSATGRWFPASNTPESLNVRCNYDGPEKKEVHKLDFATITYSYPENAHSIYCTVQANYDTVHKSTNIAKPSLSKLKSNVLVIKNIDVPSTASQPSISVDRDNNITVTVTFSQDEIGTGTDKCILQVKESVIKNGSTDYKDYSSFSGTKTKLGIKFNRATTTFKANAGKHYLVRVAGYNSSSGKAGVWTDWSDKVYTNPGIPTNLKVVADSQTTAIATFTVAGYTDSYDVEYATEAKYLGTNSEFTHIVPKDEENKSALTHDVTVHIDNLETGHTYHFRARAKRSSGEAYETQYCNPVSLSFGRKPGPPSTYSSKTAAEIGETINLYWVHNSQDGSSQMYAELALYVNNPETPIGNSTIIIPNPQWDSENQRWIDETQKDKTSIHPVELKNHGCYTGSITPAKYYDFKDGDTLYWKVRTKGVYEGPANDPDHGYGDWSALKQITMFERPEAYIMLKTGWAWDPLDLEDNVTPIEDLPAASNITNYPFAIIMGSRPVTQRVISYNLTITNIGGEYTTEDIYGRERVIPVGEVLYQNYFDNTATNGEDDLSDAGYANQKTVIFYPSDVILENGQTYRFKVDVYTVAGLTDDDRVDIPVTITDTNGLDIMASIEVDEDNLTVSIVPYCFDVDTSTDAEDSPYDEEEVDLDEAFEEGSLTQDVLLDVYRIETDGTLTMIKEGAANNGTSVFDQHPSLDYARYRIVARKIYTAAARSEDFVDTEVGCHSLVIEWDDTGTLPIEGGVEDVEYNMYSDEEDPDAILRAGLGSAYSTGFLVLPWNIDTTEEFNPDVSFVEYIGRENPVSYYGTQRGQTASWSTDIDKQDKETLFKLRRLARHMGDCYVREPSGTGYWANVKVSWSQTHNEPAVPVSITVTRVEPKEDNNAEVE